LSDDDRGRRVTEPSSAPRSLPSVETRPNEARLNRLNTRARRIGWQEALQEEFEEIGGKDSWYYRYVMDPSRASFLELLGCRSEHTVLEVGSNAGQITVALARRVKAVYGLDVELAYLRFTAMRCQHEGLTNVQLACGGDTCVLPFAEDRFDFVILNLVFEWCGSRDTGRSLIESQRQMIREAHRVLRRGGTLYLSTKNRYALSLVLGGRDPHAKHANGLRFGNTLPRWLLSALTRVRRLPRAQGLLHSYSGLVRLVKGSGFHVDKSYWAIPNPRFAVSYVPLNHQAIAAAQARLDVAIDDVPFYDRLFRMIPASLLPFFVHSLILVARK
jgi:SAM-dependent methyltransferase